MFIGRRLDLATLLRQAQVQLRSSLAVEPSRAEAWGVRGVALIWFALAAVVLEQLHRLDLGALLQSTALPALALVIVGSRLRQIRVQNVLNQLPALQISWRPNAWLQQISLDMAELVARTELLVADFCARAESTVATLAHAVRADLRSLSAVVRATMRQPRSAHLALVRAQTAPTRQLGRRSVAATSPPVLRC